MKPYLIPAETISFTEEIKIYYVFSSHTDGIEAKIIFNQLKLNTQMPGTIAGHLLLAGLMIHKVRVL